MDTLQSWGGLLAISMVLDWPCATYLADAPCIHQPPLQSTLCSLVPNGGGSLQQQCTMPLTAVALTPLTQERVQVQSGCEAAAQTLNELNYFRGSNMTQNFK